MPARLRGAGLPAGISAIIVKELRGRMRGRRAFIVITIHVLLLAGLSWMLLRLAELSFAESVRFGGAQAYASAQVGRAIFLGMLMLQTLMVAVLAPAATAGAISSEREHQTLELLTVTPISSFAIVLGKLLSALAWVFVLVLASVPVTALVFVFGGVAPDDLIRGYLVLLSSVIGFGAIGIFFSALTRRTGAATALTFVTTLVLVIGSFFIWVFLNNTGTIAANGLRRPPPEAILYLNPFVAQADVLCGTEEGAFSGTCGLISEIVDQRNQIFPPDDFPPRPEPVPGVDVGDGPVDLTIGEDGGFVQGDGGSGTLDDVVGAESFRDRFWPKAVVTFLSLAAVLTLTAVQFVSPTRRWRPSLPGPARRLVNRRGPE